MPPLCKGRWPGVSRVGGMDPLWLTGQSPSLPFGRQPPLHKGAFADSSKAKGNALSQRLRANKMSVVPPEFAQNVRTLAR